MNPLFALKELLSRVFERKWVVVSLFLLLLCSTMCGIVFIKTPVFYDYHLNICEKFLDEVCYSDKNVFLIFLGRYFSSVLFLAMVMVGGLHPVCLVLTTSFLAFRGYIFGGSLAIFFSVYRFSGALMCIFFYLPVHLLATAVLFCASSVTFSRAFRFSFCSSDLWDLLFDFLKFCLLLLAVYLLEMLLLVLFFRLGI